MSKTDFSPANEFQFKDSANIDAFGRLRVSNGNILLNAQQTYDNLPLIFDTSASVGASASYDNTQAASVMTTGTGSGNVCIRQTKEYYLYRSAQSQFIALTFASGSGETDIHKRIGYFDAADGVFLETTGSTINLVLRSTITGTFAENRVPRASWNIDSLDGNGPSKINLDLTKAQIFITDLQWLGVGRVRAGFDINGIIYYVHEFLHANKSERVYMRTAALPVRYEVVNNGSATGGTLIQLCSSVSREGSEPNIGILSCADNFNSGSATTTARSILAIALRDTHIRATLNINNVIINNRGNATIRWRVILNPSFDAGTFTYSNTGQAAKKATYQLTYTEGTGHVMVTNYSPSTATSKASIELFLKNSVSVAADINGNSDVVAIIVDSTTGTDNCDAAIIYSELF